MSAQAFLGAAGEASASSHAQRARRTAGPDAHPRCQASPRPVNDSIYLSGAPWVAAWPCRAVAGPASVAAHRRLPAQAPSEDRPWRPEQPRSQLIPAFEGLKTHPSGNRRTIEAL